MEPTLTIRCASDPKDYSLWDPHKETFRKLFLMDGLSLDGVKAKMEADHAFPMTNVKTYEVVLREHFKFRKNLQAGQWLLVRQELDRMKRQGVNCAVYVSGKPVDPKHVSKNIRRELKEAERGKLRSNKPQTLPGHVRIAPLNSFGPIRTSGAVIPSPVLDNRPTSKNNTALIPHFGSCPSQHQLSYQIETMDESVLQQMICNPISRVYYQLLETAPSKELVKLARELWEGGVLSQDEKFKLAGALHGLVYMISSYRPLQDRHQAPCIEGTPPRPRIFGLNDSLCILETACVRFANQLYPDDINQYYRPIGTWISEVADFTILRQFFALPQPAVPAIWAMLYETYTFRYRKFNKVTRILMEVALRINRGHWLRRNSEAVLYDTIIEADQDTVRLMMDSWQTSMEYKQPPKLSGFSTYDSMFYLPLANQDIITSLEVMLRESARCGVSHRDLDIAVGFLISKSHCCNVEVLHWLLEVGTKLHPAISQWAPSSAQLLRPNWDRLCGPSSFLGNDVKGIFQNTGRSRFPPCTEFMKTFTPVWGCVAAAKSGLEALNHFVSSLTDYTSERKNHLQQMALSEVVGQGDLKTTRMLLDIGKDPEVSLLPRVEWNAHLAARNEVEQDLGTEIICYLDPISRAACQGDMHMLEFLSSYGICTRRHIADALMAVSRVWTLIKRQNDPPMLDMQKRTTTIAFLLGTDIRGIWEEVSARKLILCQDLILDHCQRQIDLQVAPSTQASSLLFDLFPHDTLRKTVQHGFRLNAIQSLVDMGEKVHSEKDENGNTLLMDALFAQSKDRYHMVHFLLQRGLDVHTYNNCNITALDATLWNTGLESMQCFHNEHEIPPLTVSPTTGRMDEDRDREITLYLFNTLLELGAPVNPGSEVQQRCSKRFLVLLIHCRADISVIKRAVAAGADINERYDASAPTPLACAIMTEHLEVAQWLVHQGADVNVSWSAYGKRISILAAACMEYQALGLPFIQLLIDKGADVDPPHEEVTDSPVLFAIDSGNVDVVIMLLAHGLKINQAKEEWPDIIEYVVDIAAFHGRLDIMELFIESGGESIYPGISGFDKAFWNAHEQNQLGITMFLEQHTGVSASTVVSSLKAKRKELSWVDKGLRRTEHG